MHGYLTSKFSMRFNSLHKLEYPFDSKIVSLAICLSLFHFPFAILVVYLGGISTTTALAAIRIGLLLLFLYPLILKLLTGRTSFYMHRSIVMLLVFLFVYTLKILIDVYSGIKFSGSSNAVTLSIYFGSILIPIIALIISARFIVLSQFLNLFFLILFAANLIYLGLVIDMFGIESFNDVLNFRNGRYRSISSDEMLINPIGVGLFGALLFVYSISSFVKTNQNRYFLLFCCLLGFVNLILGGSRGPFLGLLFSLFVLFISSLKTKDVNLFFVKCILLSVIVIAFFSLLYFWSQDAEAPLILKRLSETSITDTENSGNIRVLLWKSAFNDFVENPILGKHFISTLTNHYPHNILIEPLMATGIVGSVFFFSFFFSVMIKMKNFLFSYNVKKQILVVIYSQILMSSLFSGCLFQSDNFWLIGVLILIVNK